MFSREDSTPHTITTLGGSRGTERSSHVAMVSLMARHGGDGGPIVRYTPWFLVWLRIQISMIEDLPYVGMDYRGDLDMALPPRA